MQEQAMNKLMNTALDSKLEGNPVEAQRRVKQIAKDNREALEKVVDQRDYNRIPSAEDIEKMRGWAVEYKKQNKNASKREVRKATQEHFNIRIYK